MESRLCERDPISALRLSERNAGHLNVFTHSGCSLKIRQQQLGTEHPNVAQSLNNLAALYRSQCRYGEAEPLLVQALELRQRQLGPDHSDVANSLNNLAGLYDLQGRYGEAEPLFRQALEISQRQLGPDLPMSPPA